MVVVGCLFCSVVCFILHCGALKSAAEHISRHSAQLLCYRFFGLSNDPFSSDALRWGIRFVVLAALIIALDGLHQYFFRYDDYDRYLQEYDPFSSQEMEQAAHTWISALSGRVFTQFFRSFRRSLPGISS
jgi:hypothetical protein